MRRNCSMDQKQKHRKILRTIFTKTVVANKEIYNAPLMPDVDEEDLLSVIQNEEKY